MREKVVGVLGGKGPEATAALLQFIIKHSPIKKEEDHLRVIIDNNPKIPKPALGITGEGPDPFPALSETARNLERAGADFIVIPCNSAHYYLNRLRAEVAIPILSIIDATVEAAKEYNCLRVGVLATTGLIQSGLYQEGFSKSGIQVLIPKNEEQMQLMRQIIHFKDSGEKKDLRGSVEDLVNTLHTRGADGVALACTEIPVVYSANGCSIPCFDTIEVLARAAIRFAHGKR